MIIKHTLFRLVSDKSELSSDQIKGSIDVPMISQRKNVDFSSPYRLYWDSVGGEILLYVKEDIPSHLLSIETNPIEGFYEELNLRNDKWLINCFYNTNKT